MSKLWLPSHIDDGICLDVVHIWVADAQLFSVSLGGADDARRDRVLEGKGTANSNHKLARSQVCRATQQQNRQLFLRGVERINIQKAARKNLRQECEERITTGSLLLD